jgi:hypothetical protein
MPACRSSPNLSPSTKRTLKCRHHQQTATNFQAVRQDEAGEAMSARRQKFTGQGEVSDKTAGLLNKNAARACNKASFPSADQTSVLVHSEATWKIVQCCCLTRKATLLGICRRSFGYRRHSEHPRDVQAMHLGIARGRQLLLLFTAHLCSRSADEALAAWGQSGYLHDAQVRVVLH